MNKKRITALLTAAVTAAVTLAGCGGGASGSASSTGSTSGSTTGSTVSTSEVDAAKGTTLVYGSNDYTRINPAIDEHGEINLLLFDGLTAHDADNQVVPGLAESWDLDDATNTYTFHLRDGVKWHDGETFTADDVKFTIDAIQNPDNESEIASNYEDVKEIKIVDEKTISFTLEDKNVAFLEYMTIGILPKHLLEGKDMQTDEYFHAPVGTGPYKLQEWDEGQSITLVKNEDYYKGTPGIDTIVFKIVPDDNAKALQLKSGELDFAKITPKDAETFSGDEQYTVYDMKTADYRGILYNFNNEFWQKNKDVIPGINYGIDRKAMVDSVLLGEGEVAYGPLQRNIYNDEAVEHYDYNPEKAKEVIEAAGWTLGSDGIYEKGGEKLSFTINVMEGDQVRADLAAIASQQLAEIGVDAKSQVQSKIDWANQEAFLIGWGSPFDADDHTYKVFGTDKGSNYSGYSNSEVDQYLTEARQTDDTEARKAAYAKFQETLAADPAYTFFCYVDVDYVSNKNIQGISKDTILGHHGVGIFWNVSEWTVA